MKRRPTQREADLAEQRDEARRRLAATEEHLRAALLALRKIGGDNDVAQDQELLDQADEEVTAALAEVTE